MVEDIIAGIAKALKQAVDCPVYAEEAVPQDREGPAFFIDFLGCTETPRVYPRAYRSQPFDIHFFPVNGANRMAMHQVAESLYPLLLFVEGESGDKYHGTKLRHEIVDGVLHLFVNYNVHVMYSAPQEPGMEEIRIENK